MSTRRDGPLVTWWRYFLIFMGVSFNKIRAVHGLSEAEEVAIESIRAGLRDIAKAEGVRALLDQARRDSPGHLSETVWKKLSLNSDFVRGFQKPKFEEAIMMAALPPGVELYLSRASGEKVAFSQKPGTWNHFDQNVHRFPMAGEEYTEILLKVTFDPDSEVRAVEQGVPVLSSEGKPIGSLVAHLAYARLRALAARPG